MHKLIAITTGLLASLLLVSGCDSTATAQPAKPASAGMKMLVLGMDGLDPKLMRKLLAEKPEQMKNFQKIIDQGSFTPLGTSMPPQSPVAWSNFISGARPNTHMIWDFIHRDPAPDDDAPLRLYQSTGDVQEVEVPGYKKIFGESLPWLGGTRLPLYSESALESFRKGPAFWEQLVSGGVDTTIYRVPANYPPPVSVEGRGRFRCLCGMGTPDMLGGYGTFTSFRTDITRDKDVAGGVIRKLDLRDNAAESYLAGPPNAFLPAEEGKAPPPLKSPVRFVIDPDEQTVKITASGTTAVLKEGEWSEWITVTLDSEVPLLGTALGLSPTATVRFRATTIGPNVLNVYCSPMQIDPLNPAQPISTPSEWAAEIAEKAGSYYTTGIPEDTKALRANPQGLTEDEFLEMVQNLARERHAQYKVALSEFTEGFLFFYFGHTDQLAHIFWRDIDPEHPGRLPEQDGKYDHVIEEAYLEMDERLGEALEIMDDDDIVIVMSDHGFSSFRRGFNVNTWLQINGYQEWFGTTSRDRALKYFNIDFAQSQAYAVGINSLYINLAGREKNGTVSQAAYTALLHEIGDKLLAYRDPDNGLQVIEKIYYVQEEFPGVDNTVAPDMLIGYAANYRGSWSTATGGMSSKVVSDNKDRWSGDHCIAHYLVPGTLIANRKITLDDPTLSDLAPSILALWGLDSMKDMTGRKIFAE